MRAWSKESSQRHPTWSAFRRIPGRMLVPFLLFWCLGSFALGEEISHLPLTSFASAIVRPLQSVGPAQGQIAHVAPASRPHTVATGVLGGKPGAPFRRTSGKTAHGTTRSTARVDHPAPAYSGVSALGGTRLMARGHGGHGNDGDAPWILLAPNASDTCASRAQWVVDSGWGPQGRWTVQWVAADGVH